jgi:hypothetical protein
VIKVIQELTQQSQVQPGLKEFRVCKARKEFPVQLVQPVQLALKDRKGRQEQYLHFRHRLLLVLHLLLGLILLLVIFG